MKGGRYKLSLIFIQHNYKHLSLTLGLVFDNRTSSAQQHTEIMVDSLLVGIILGIQRGLGRRQLREIQKRGEPDVGLTGHGSRV